VLSQMSSHVIPKITIAICNKNMADTLWVSLVSVLDQINSDFEVLVIDDGSRDTSREILLDLKKIYSNLRIKFLPEDSSRKLGETRNISIRESFGEWIIFHIDTDDYIHPGIVQFSSEVINLDSKCSRSVLYAGKQIHMAKREFLIEHGPFANIYRGEDRNLYERLASESALFFIEHPRFISRMARKRTKLIKKRIIDEIDQISNDIRKSLRMKIYLISLKNQVERVGIKRLLIRTLIALFVYKSSLKKGPISVFQKTAEYSTFLDYRMAHTHTFEDWAAIMKNQHY
jgi:glycosyltransferase involved in cell wall biosynthesis